MTDGIRWRQGLTLLAAVLICLGAGAIGSSFRPGAWYAALDKPPGTPPDWVFAPVWTTLYILIGIALWLWWRSGVRRLVLTLFALQLVLNVLWSALFFGAQRPALALVELCLLIVVIIATMQTGRRSQPWAAMLMLPYLLWVSYALYLNTGIVLLNH